MLCFVIISTVILSDSVVHRGTYVYNLVLLIKCQNLVTSFVLQERFAVVYVPKATQKTVQGQQALRLRETIQNNVVKQTHCSITNKALYNFRELANEMSCRYTSYRPSIHANFTFYLDTVDKELQNPFSVDFLLLWS